MQGERVQFEADEQVGIITLNRSQAANAKTEQVPMEPDNAWHTAEENREARLIVLSSNGKHPSAGHDPCGSSETSLQRQTPPPDPSMTLRPATTCTTRKRRCDVFMPSIAAVKGKCIAAGVMLNWPRDLIVAATNARFSNPVLHLGLCGGEYHAHAWRFGGRKAKGYLFTTGSITTEQAEQLGMASMAVPLDDPMSATFGASASHPGWTASHWLGEAKRAPNRTPISKISRPHSATVDRHYFGHTLPAQGTCGVASLAACRR